MEFSRNRPIFLQIVEEMIRRIARGELLPGEQLPSVRELATELHVNPNTVQKAYQELERRGIIFTMRGQGSFATENVSMIAGLRTQAAVEAARRFMREARGLGLTAEETMALLAALSKNEHKGSG
ncbi:MAG: GntR family transcriptional regulator [Bacillota bacterium]